MQSVVSSSLGHCYDLYLNGICLKYAKVLWETDCSGVYFIAHSVSDYCSTWTFFTQIENRESELVIGVHKKIYLILTLLSVLFLSDLGGRLCVCCRSLHILSVVTCLSLSLLSLVNKVYLSVLICMNVYLKYCYQLRVIYIEWPHSKEVTPPFPLRLLFLPHSKVSLKQVASASRQNIQLQFGILLTILMTPIGHNTGYYACNYVSLLPLQCL